MCRELYIVSVVWATHLEPGGKLLATAGTMMSGSSSKLAWIPSACSESFTSASTNTPDDWEVCDWSEEEGGSSDDWADCDWSPRCSSEADLGLVTPTDSDCRFEYDASPSCNQSTTSLHKSPRIPKHKPKFDPSGAVTNEERWHLSCVMELQGCQVRCVTQVHGLSEYDVLIAHSAFSTKSPSD